MRDFIMAFISGVAVAVSCVLVSRVLVDVFGTFLLRGLIVMVPFYILAHCVIYTVHKEKQDD
jgi:hypothetical protein